MKTANWENPEMSLELQLGDQPTNLLHDQVRDMAKRLHRAILRAFPKPVDWNKLQACIQKSEETVHNYYNRLQIKKKKFWSSFMC